MQDGALAHTAHSVKDYFAKNKIRVLDWCARSPDLNPIEHIWAWMDRQLARIRITSIELELVKPKAGTLNTNFVFVS